MMPQTSHRNGEIDSLYSSCKNLECEGPVVNGDYIILMYEDEKMNITEIRHIKEFDYEGLVELVRKHHDKTKFGGRIYRDGGKARFVGYPLGHYGEEDHKFETLLPLPSTN